MCMSLQHYEDVLGYRPGSYHEVEYGLLWQSDLHHSFDRGNWAFSPDPQDPHQPICHVFADSSAKAFHGKRIPRTRFRIDDEIELPKHGFLRF